MNAAMEGGATGYKENLLAQVNAPMMLQHGKLDSGLRDRHLEPSALVFGPDGRLSRSQTGYRHTVR